MTPHQEEKAIYFKTFDGATGRPTENGPRHSPIRLIPARQKTASDFSRQNSDNCIGRAEDTHPARTRLIQARVQKAPPRQNITTAATGREINAMDSTGDSAMSSLGQRPPACQRVREETAFSY